MRNFCFPGLSDFKMASKNTMKKVAEKNAAHLRL